MGTKVDELRQKMAQKLEEAQALVEAAEAEDRDLTDEEREQFDALMAEADNLKARAKRMEKVNIEVRELREPQRGAVKPEPSGRIGMEERDVQQYSLLRAIRAAEKGDWRGAELEREASEEVAKRLGHEPRGFFVPFDVLEAPLSGSERRGIVTGIDTQGGYLVGQEPITFIEMLYARMALRKAGARTLMGLVGDLPLSRMTGGATMQWVDENGEAAESDYTFAQVNLSPKSASATVPISRRTLLQSSIDVERLVREDIAQAIALGIDRTALHGSGTAPEPLGLANNAEVSVVAIGADGGAPEWRHIVALETAIANANADVQRMAYITNPKVRGHLKTALKASGVPAFIWENGANPLNGYRALVTTQVRGDLTKGNGSGLSAIFFGNWQDLIIGIWGTGLDLLVDPYTQGRKGQLLVTGFMDVDIAPRHPESFAVILDAAV